MTIQASGTRGWAWSRTAIGFRPEFLDFARGIRVGNLEPHERITRILKAALEARYRQDFITERWGRGVFWQWIGFLARANRAAKPLSSHVSFGCSKFFITVDTDDRLFKCGLQVERGFLRAPAGFRECQLRTDWDWHRLIQGLTPRGALTGELRRLAREGFHVQAGSWSAPHVFRRTLPPAAALRAAATDAPARDWCGFQLYYGLAEDGIQGLSGADLVETMMAVFDEVTPAMNCCSQVSIPTLADPSPGP
jgi:hypothetical protein